MMSTEKAIALFERRTAENPRDFLSFTMLGQLHARSARETGHLTGHTRAEAAFRAALKVQPEYAPALEQLAASCLAVHRFSEALDLATHALKVAPQSLNALLLLADAQLALGRYAEAGRSLEELQARAPADAPPLLLRRAEWALIHGKNDEALRLVLQAAEGAEQDVTLPSEAAVYRLRAGELYLRTGQLEQAAKQYEAVAQLDPGSWQMLEHSAELRAAEGKFDEAVALLEKAIALAPRPELQKMLGDIHAFLRRTDEAKLWHDRALAAFLASAERGETHYFHHLSEFFADARDPVAALKWARKDFETRQSIGAYATLARALHESRAFAEAADAMTKALATGIKDPHLLQQASLIWRSAGDLVAAKAALEEARTLNPRIDTFHVHR